ncbi:hypothetical protein BsIDN1_14670 [Bacillus safensis]|uniref:Uncharacterized protein n=1 Tax=Bacillus safensis TaxID=561879 RepID=A0A5S9M7E0_BACIA|nr:hypothetical protein BsIDN1_14670 [Bacillus safensis]
MKDAIQTTHQNTLDYVRKPVGKTEADINSFFAQVMDDPSIQIVTDAQKWYAQEKNEGYRVQKTYRFYLQAPRLKPAVEKRCELLYEYRKR